MKNYLIISLLFLSLGFSQKEYNVNDLVNMDSVWTEKFSDVPPTGNVFGYFGEDGNLKKVYVGNLLNGKQEGRWTFWFNNGRKSSEGFYKNGIKDGLETLWYNNGRKELEGTYKDGKLDGLFTFWYEDGQKEIEGNINVWGRLDGLRTEWYENGQKKKEEKYVEGIIFSRKSWNEDGSVKN